ncbi:MULTISPECIES: Crp/Fnr family transcriptional regulator [unclassified Saccharothrix]|uniref:Crp/Fnr family transcriptional regulator n=1 Tax=unclassified Saccharothrix TaxID=2593673 RepID=UPI00307DB507
MSRATNAPGWDTAAADDLIEGSSFGTVDACDLRDRTPPAVVDAILAGVGNGLRRRLTSVREPVRGIAAPRVPAPAVQQHSGQGTRHRGLVAHHTVGQLALQEDSAASGIGWPSNSLLGRLRENTRQELLNIGTVVRYTADRDVIEQDANDTHVLLLLEGVVKVQVTDETGDTALLAVRSAGDLVGEMAALDQRPRSASVVTCGDVVAKLITSGELMSFLHRRNDVFVELINVINDRLRWANQRRRDFLSHPAAERVARVVVELVQTYGREEAHGWTLGIPLTKVELASIAGMKPRTAEKAFSDLRKAGVVITHLRRDLLIPDLDRLRKFAGI